MKIFGAGLDKSKTFKPKRAHRAGTKRFELHKYAQATLGTGNLHEAVTLPDGEDANEWLAVNTVDFFNEINLLYGVIAEFCTEQACPIMCAGPKYEYMWADGKEVKRPVAVSAPRYVDYLMTWVQSQLDDEKVFPTQLGVPFPVDFLERVQNIFKRLFRVYAHIYYCHFERMAALGAEPHLNTCFKHYMYFVYEFNLIPKREELQPLQELIDKLIERDTISPKCHDTESASVRDSNGESHERLGQGDITAAAMTVSRCEIATMCGAHTCMNRSVTSASNACDTADQSSGSCEVMQAGTKPMRAPTAE